MEEVRKIQPFIQAESKRVARDLTREYTPYYENVTIPVMVIGSEDDLLFPKEDLEKTASAYNVEPVIMSKMCHDMMIDPDWMTGAEEILNFLEKSL